MEEEEEEGAACGGATVFNFFFFFVKCSLFSSLMFACFSKPVLGERLIEVV